MSKRNLILALGGGLVLGVSGLVNAETPATGSNMQAELATMKARIAELEGRQNDKWLNERRAEEVKALVKEVLADADTRASLLADGLTAGHKDKFFIASEDGTFELNVSGQIQVRYIANFRDGNDTNSLDEDEAGFQIRRTKLTFDGHVGSPKFTYVVQLAADRSGGDVELEKVLIGYELADGLTISGGRDKAPFLREELVSSKYQLAVERSLLNENFTTDWSEGVYAVYASDVWKLHAALTDGTESDGTDFEDDNTNFAATGRLELLLAGKWAQFRDFSSWQGDDTGLLLGAALNYELTETGDPTGGAPDQTLGNDSIFGWTADVSFEAGGFNAFAAVVGRYTNAVDGGDSLGQYGILLQAGYMIVPDKVEIFGRYEWMDMDAPGVPGQEVENSVSIITAGANFYLNKHSAKFSLDVLFALDSLDGFNGVSTTDGLGILDDTTDEDGQIVVRGQFQLLF